MDAIDPVERQRLIEEAFKGRDNVIRYNLQTNNDWTFQQEIDGLRYFTRQTSSPIEIAKYERDYLQLSKLPLEECTTHQIHLAHGVYRPVLFLIKRDHVGVEYIGKIQYEGTEYHIASCRSVQTPFIPLYKDFDRSELSTGLTIEPRNEGRYSFVKYTIIMKLDRVSPNFCGKVQGLLKSAVMCKALSVIPTFKHLWENDDEDEDDQYSDVPVKPVISELKDRLSVKDCEDLPAKSEKYLRYNDWAWEQVGSFDDVMLNILQDPTSAGDFNLAWKLTFTSTLLHPVAQLLAFDNPFNRLLWDPCTTSVQILFEDNPYLVLLVKGGGWDSETGCTPFQYVCRTYAVAGENYDWIFEEHDNGDVFLFKLSASNEDFSITIVDAKSSNWEFKLTARQYTDIISLTLTDLFVNAVVDFRNVLVSGVSISTTVRNQIRSRRPRTPRPRRLPQKESSLEKLKKHARTADQLKIHGNVAASISRRRSFRMLPPPIVFTPSPRNSIDLEFSKIDFNKQFSIAILPDEIVLEIFALLSLSDLCKCAQVCANWRKISEDHVLWAFDPTTLYKSSNKGEDWVLYYTTAQNIYSTTDTDTPLNIVGDSPATSPQASASQLLTTTTATHTQPQTNPYTAAYNHVYNTYANHNNNYPFNPPPPFHTNPAFPQTESPPTSTASTTLPPMQPHSPFTNSAPPFQFATLAPTAPSSSDPFSPTLSFPPPVMSPPVKNNNIPAISNNNNIINNNNLQYAFDKLQQFSQGEKTEEKPEVDVDTLNPNIYGISINDGPAETIHVNAARKRYASAWPYKELKSDAMDVDGRNSNANSGGNSGVTSANTSFTNFFELSVPSVHEFVRKTFRSFRPQRKHQEEVSKNQKRESLTYLKSMENWASGKFKRYTSSYGAEGLCSVTSLTFDKTSAYCGYANGLLNVFEMDGKISRFRLMPHAITDISLDDTYMYIGLANGSCCQINNESNKVERSYNLLYEEDQTKVIFGRSPSSVIATWEVSTSNVDLHNWNNDTVVAFNQENEVECVQVGAQRIVVGLDDGSLALWDVADPSAALLHFRSHELEPTCLQLSPNEKIVTSGSKDGCVMVWDERAGPYYVKRFKVKSNEIRSLETKEYKLVVGMQNGIVAYWDPRYLFRPLHSWRLHEKGSPFVQAKLNDTESHMVCGAADGFVGIYDFS